MNYMTSAPSSAMISFGGAHRGVRSVQEGVHNVHTCPEGWARADQICQVLVRCRPT